MHSYYQQIDDSTIIDVEVGEQSYIVTGRDGEWQKTPAFVDTTFDSVQVLIFKDYPDEFPRAVSKPSLRELIEGKIGIESVEIAILGDTAKIISFSGDIDTKTRVPVAAQFYIYDYSSGKLIDSGMMRIGNGNFDCYSGSDILNWNKFSKISSDVYSKKSFISTISIEHASRVRQFDASLPKPARLVLVPSQEVARLAGDVYEYWGDSISINITFTLDDR